MKLIEKKGLRILVPTYGYVLKNKKSGDVFAGRIYLGKTASPDDYEEIEDRSVNMSILNTFVDIDTREQSLTKIGKIVANQVTDDAVALSIREFYDIWEIGISYCVGRYITYNDILYKVLIEHTSQAAWTPDVTPSLFAKVLIDPSGETIPEWVQPDSTNAYMIGDKVKFEGNVYESVIDNNIWSPTAYPAGWKLVE
jgi:hypothetical protein